MDAKEFVKVSVAGLGVRLIPTTRLRKPRCNGYTCAIRFPGLPTQTAVVPLVFGEPDSRPIAANFYMEAAEFDRLFIQGKASCLLQFVAPCLEITLRCGSRNVGVFRCVLNPDWTDGMVVHTGWSNIGNRFELHSVVRLELDPRYEFQFDGDVALSPQVNGSGIGNKHQPVFTCKFTRGRTRAMQGDLTPSRTPRRDSVDGSRERKGWIVTIHDLSGSPVAAASMVTPFVPFTGSDEVRKSNPGGWLILVPDVYSMDSHRHPSWRAWGRLEAWREESGKMGLRFQLISDTGTILVSETSISSSKRLSIETGTSLSSPSPSPRSSGDCSFYLGLPYETSFVMSCQPASCSRSKGTVVQVSTRHIGCVEDAAVFMALAAAVDLSRDACQPFSRRLRKELCREAF